jgi:hypothetical protein
MEVQINNINGNNFGTASNVYDVYKKSGDRNSFELVLDGLILERYSDNEEMKNYIKSLPKENKRLATVALLSDDNVLWSQINELVKKKQSSYERLRGVYNLIKEYVKIADVDRKGKGEIHTPFKELAEPMVKLVEKYNLEFWKNPNHKVLDSSAGYGTFLILAAYKFMVGLKDVIKDEEERFKWIVENCLYYGELQARSAFSWLIAIDPFDQYETNIFWGDFLSEDFDRHMKEIWQIDAWNLIIQNPPYQIRKEGFKKTQPLWHLFVQKSLTILKEDGYMVMVHPSGWRNVDGDFKDVQILLKSNQLLEISIHDEREGEEIFGATTGFDYYILKKSSYRYETKIFNKENVGKLNLLDFEFIPSGMFELFSKLIAKNGEERVNLLHSFSAYETRKPWVSRNMDSKFIYPLSYTIQKDETINFFYSTRKDRGHFGIPKVIWSNGKASSPVIDYNGDYGLTQFSYGIVDDKWNLFSIKNAMDSDRFINLMKSCDMNDGNRFNKKILSLFRKDFWKEFYDIEDLKTIYANLVGYMLKNIKLGCDIDEIRNKFNAIKHGDYDEFIKLIQGSEPLMVVYNNGVMKTSNFSSNTGDCDFVMMMASAPSMIDFYKRCISTYGNNIDVQVNDVIYKKLALFEISLRIHAKNNNIVEFNLVDIIDKLSTIKGFQKSDIDILHNGRKFLNKIKRQEFREDLLFDFEKAYNFLYKNNIRII